MFEENYSFDVVDEAGNTPLMIAIKRGYEEIVCWLLELNSNLSKKNNEGLTAYQLAMNYKNSQIIDMIKNHMQKNQKITNAKSLTTFGKTNNKSEELDLPSENESCLKPQ